MNKYEEEINIPSGVIEKATPKKIGHMTRIEKYKEKRMQLHENGLRNALSELVERVTPKKPILVPNGNSESVRECPNCHCRRRVSLNERYCDWCGQALKWGSDH